MADLIDRPDVKLRMVATMFRGTDEQVIYNLRSQGMKEGVFRAAMAAKRLAEPNS